MEQEYHENWVRIVNGSELRGITVEGNIHQSDKNPDIDATGEWPVIIPALSPDEVFTFPLRKDEYEHVQKEKP